VPLVAGANRFVVMCTRGVPNLARDLRPCGKQIAASVRLDRRNRFGTATLVPARVTVIHGRILRSLRTVAS
jgi:hypothetical protein